MWTPPLVTRSANNYAYCSYVVEFPILHFVKPFAKIQVTLADLAHALNGGST